MVGLVFIMLLDFTYQMLTRQAFELAQVLFRPFDLIFAAFGLLLAAGFKGDTRSRDLSWAILIGGLILVLFSGALSVPMEDVFVKVVFSVGLPNGLAGVALWISLNLASRGG